MSLQFDCFRSNFNSGRFMVLLEVEKSVSAMETRRVALFRTRLVQQLVTRSVHCESKENVDPLLRNELEIAGQERPIIVRCLPRRHLRVPLRDITHLFPGNAASLDDKIETSPLVLQALGNGQERRPSQNSRKRRHPEPVFETPSVRRVLRKFR